MPKNNNLKNIFILVLLCYVFFMLGNGIISLSIPDEVFYAQTAKEMGQRGSWMTPYMFGQPQFEKPIFLYWLLRVGFLIFGMTNFAARFFPAVFGGIGVLALYFLGLLGFRDQKKAFLAALILLSCGLYVGLARTVFTDMIFAVFIELALIAFYWGYAFREKKTLGLLLFYVFAALAVLAKGPLGFLIPAGAIALFLLIRKEIKFLFCKAGFWGLLIFFLL
ncbi:MAG: glycosyltransferase family 39 protein, partial [Candidatus Omnitrophota bacterium]|nr:glycosyltransferase family 39 protein [Candidatus Omnitrophota bacterium]